MKNKEKIKLLKSALELAYVKIIELEEENDRLKNQLNSFYSVIDSLSDKETEIFEKLESQKKNRQWN